MVKVAYRLITFVTILRLTLDVACIPEGGAAFVETSVSRTPEGNDGRQSYDGQFHGIELASRSLDQRVVPVWEIIFLLFNLLFFGSSMHDWIGPKPPKPPHRGEEPYIVTFEVYVYHQL